MRYLVLFAVIIAIVLSPEATGSVFAQASTIVILVRHAEKADGGSDPELSAAGKARALDLYEALADVRVDRIITTQYKRTYLTAQVVADSLDIEPMVVAASGGLAAHVKAVADAVRAAGPGSAVLVVGHSNTVPAIITALGGPPMGDLDESEYSNMFILQVPETGTPRLIQAHYGQPDS